MLPLASEDFSALSPPLRPGVSVGTLHKLWYDLLHIALRRYPLQ